MKRHKHSVVRGFTVFVVWAVCLVMSATPGFSQSPLVFMTIDDIVPVVQTKLVRFDSGVETFGVNAGPASAFQGVTMLNGEVLVSDYGNEAIQRFSQAGAYLGPFALFSNPTFLESDNSGNVYTTHASLGPAVATRFNSAGGVTQTYSHITLNQPAGVDADAAGNVYVADSTFGGYELFKFAANGTFLNSIALGSAAYDLSIDEASSMLYLAGGTGGANGIRIFDVSGAVPSLVGNIATPANADIYGIHWAPLSGTVLATDFGSQSFNPRGLEYSLAGALLDEYVAAGAEVAFDITTPGVPEPASATLALVVLGMLGLGLRARHRGA